MKRLNFRIGIGAVGLMIGFTASAAALDGEKQRAMEQTARAMFEQDQAVAQVTDHLVECCDLLSTERLVGWATSEMEGGDIRVTYVSLSEDKTPYAAFSAVASLDGEVRGAADVRDPPRPLAGRELAQYRARMLAMTSGVEMCSSRYNTVAMPEENGDWMIYLLRTTLDADAIPAGIHYRFRISASGNEILEQRRYTNACMLLPKASPPALTIITHHLDPHPTEVHLYLTLSTEQTLLVMTGDDSGPQSIWAVGEGRIGERIER